MAIKDLIATYAADFSTMLATISTNITTLQAKLADGTVTPAEVAAAMDPIKASLTAASAALAALAGGTTPPTEPL